MDAQARAVSGHRHLHRRADHAARQRQPLSALVKLNKIYTRTGDAGQAGLVDGSRVSKASPRMHAIGEVDEANSAVGLALTSLDGRHAEALGRIQNELFDLGADLATP